jgi:hypothetical protein
MQSGYLQTYIGMGCPAAARPVNMQVTLSPCFGVTPSPSLRTIFWSEAME